jgi:hypothetical protein
MEDWKRQGIYDEDWPLKPNPWLWLHEQPIKPESEPEASPPPFSFGLPISRPHSNSEHQKRLSAERRFIRERHREASRPFHQFIHQVSRERERLLVESNNRKDTSIAPNISTRTYEDVVKVWKRRKLWNHSWGVMPGMSWMHEEPFEGQAADSPAPVDTDQPEDGFHGIAEATYPQAPGILNTSQQNISTAYGSIVSKVGEVDQTSSAQIPSSLHRRYGRVSAATKQGPRRSKGKLSHQAVQAQPFSSTILGPFHASKISKRAGKSTVSPSSSKPLPVTDNTSLRRSSRLRPLQLSRADNSDLFVPTDSRKTAKPARAAAGISTRPSSGKANGISKERVQRHDRTRRKAKKD